MPKDLDQTIKASLWRLYGDPKHPAEWDGLVYGGGKLSQRFWEYHKAIELLNLTADSVVLDIGGGSPVSGEGFLTQVIAPHVKAVHLMDECLGHPTGKLQNVLFHRLLADRESLSKVLRENPEITHIVSVSVFEHIDPGVRKGIIGAIDAYFQGNVFVCTLEFHSKQNFFEHQLVTESLSSLFQPFSKFYPDSICEAPYLSENAFGGTSHLINATKGLMERFNTSKRRGNSAIPRATKKIREPSIGGQTKIGRIFSRVKKLWQVPEVPMWHPVAFRFRRIPDC